MRIPLPALVAALVAPALVAGAWLAWLGHPLPTEVPEVTRRLDASLAKGDAEVVILGASKVYTDVDKPKLAAGLHVKPVDLVNLAQSGSNAPLWYAILKNRVYAGGHRPKLVIVYSTVDWMLGTDLSPAIAARLAGQLQGEEPVLAEKVYDGRSPTGWLARVGDARADVREAVFGWTRDVSVGLLLAPPGAEPLRDRGNALATPALDRLFGLNATLETAEATRVIPIAEADREGTDVEARSIDDTLAPDFLDLAEAHGTRIVFVRAPVRRSQEASFDISPDLERAFIELLNARGAGYLDLRAMRLPDAQFGDAAHANAAGRAVITAAILQGLADIHALDAAPLAPAPLPPTWERPTSRRTGTPPTLPALAPSRNPLPCGWDAKAPGWELLSDLALQRGGIGQATPLVLLEDGEPLRPHATREQFGDTCAGAWQSQGKLIKFSPTGKRPEDAQGRTYTLAWSDAAPLEADGAAPTWWVYPGTTLHLEWTQGFGAEPFGYDLAAFAAGGGDGVATVQVASGAPTPLTREGLSLHARGVTPAPTSAWTVEITSPADGPALLIQRFVAGNRGDARWYVGDGAGGDRAESAAAMAQAEASYEADPAEIPAPALLRTEPTGVAVYDLSPLDLPDPKRLFEVASVAGCTPVRVNVGGSDLGLPSAKGDPVVTTPGKFAQVGAELWVHPAQPGAPTTVTLDPSRKCRGLRWLYPGDVLRLDFPAGQLASLADPVTELSLALAALNPGDARVRLRLLVDGVPRLDTELVLAEAVATPPHFPLDPPIPGGGVQVELSTAPGAPYVLVTSLAMTGVATGLVP